MSTPGVTRSQQNSSSPPPNVPRPIPRGVGDAPTTVSSAAGSRQSGTKELSYSERAMRWICLQIQSLCQFLSQFIRGLCPCFFKKTEKTPPPETSARQVTSAQQVTIEEATDSEEDGPRDGHIRRLIRTGTNRFQHEAGRIWNTLREYVRTKNQTEVPTDSVEE